MLRRTSTILSLFLFFLLPTFLSSQLTIDVIAGINASKHTDSGHLYKLGPLVGGRIKYYKTSRLKFGAGIHYNRKGYKTRYHKPLAPYQERKFNRHPDNYLELQPFIEYDIKKRFGVVVGFNLGLLVFTDNSNFLDYDCGILFGIKYELDDRYTLSFYHTEGLLDLTKEIRARYTNRNISNQLVLAYRVFSKKRE